MGYVQSCDSNANPSLSYDSCLPCDTAYVCLPRTQPFLYLVRGQEPAEKSSWFHPLLGIPFELVTIQRRTYVVSHSCVRLDPAQTTMTLGYILQLVKTA